MGELRAAYTELRFFLERQMSLADTDQDATGAPESTQHLTDSVWHLLCLDMIGEVMLRKTGLRVIYRLISALFYRPSESDWKEKKGAFVVSFH